MKTKINYAGVDWITCTTVSDQVGSKWYQIFCRETSPGGLNSIVNNRWHNGYYAGFTANNIKFGYNPEIGYIMIASSDAANRLHPSLRIKPSRITRLDLCVDIVLPKAQPLAKIAYKQALKKGLSKARKYTLWSGSDQGSTLYVGSRQSQQYGRLYDKGVESKMADPGEYWRFEVEYKKPLSMAIGDHLDRFDGRALDTEITNRVGQWFSDRGVRSADHIAKGIAAPVLAMKVSTTENRKLAWLRTQVSPTVEMLIEAGLGRQVLLNLFQKPESIRRMLDESADLL